MSVLQRTVAKDVAFSGVGLHTGESVAMRVVPAPADTGVVFIRTDLPHRPAIPATADHAVDVGRAARRTTIAKDGVEVQTIEHFMAALWGLGIDNVYVEVSGAELPGLDGSAMPFVQQLAAIGTTEQRAPRKSFVVREPVTVEDGDSSITIVPDRELSVAYTLSYPHPMLRSQFVTFGRNGQPFAEVIAPARTFCLLEEAEALRVKGFGKGASYDNTLVIGNGGVIENTLRFDDEFARHKVLDLLGDLSLLGATVQGRVIAVKSGHSLNIKLVRKLRQAMEQWTLGALQSVSREVMAGPHLDILQIQKILPHRYPFLLVDRVMELSEAKAVGVKNVTINEHFFQGHFPNRPIMPGVLIIEAMAQVGGILILNKTNNMHKLVYFMSVDKVKFRKPVVPGDQLLLEAELGKVRSRIGQIFGRAFVEGKLVCEGELMFAIQDE